MPGINLNTRVDPEVYDRLDDLCVKTGRDRPALIRAIVNALCRATTPSDFNRACVAALDAIDSVVRAPPPAEATAAVEAPAKKARARSA